MAASLLYGAISLYFLLMFAMGDCLAHGQIPPGRCWSDDITFETWASWSVGGYMLVSLGYWWLIRRKVPSP